MTATIGIAVVVLAVLIALAVYAGVRRRPDVPAPQPRRRAFELEEHIGDLLTGPTHRYGRIFTKYEVWKDDHETRLELVAGATWKRLNEFARSLVVRYLWQALERIAGSAVVIVDVPAQEWNAEADTHFQDDGWDWLTFPSPWLNGPQYIKE
jgi:hypothetical protein